MKIVVTSLLVVFFMSCKTNEKESIKAQSIIDKSIEASGGNLHIKNRTSFVFRGRKYVSEPKKDGFRLSRIYIQDSMEIEDVKYGDMVKRSAGGSVMRLHDTLSKAYANSINSVHYFSKLPFGLNDAAVRKKSLENVFLNGSEYYKVEITFQEDGGGDDFEDVYVYWINAKTYLPDFLAYSFTTNGGGRRFRVAFNERYINGIRFVDYKNYKPKNAKYPVKNLDIPYAKKELDLLSTIELKEIEVTQGNYN
ncbi:DUF6503 family protein [uncultured Maribacter sp.]|uniref:DUF6503 family protein n=1 Tax=uncultured Maribacter sp. TaxID=431308 RepID=UPI00260A2401|nr:DUF6503 family protein [uncultured Maribacter sp.]